MGIPADSIRNPVPRTEPPIAKAHAALLDIMSIWEHDEHGHQEAGELMYQRAKEALEAMGALKL